tara:strand:- start:91 stop:225 length:135 start_codon:yes stop_codon:yes gene_type:complete
MPKDKMGNLANTDKHTKKHTSSLKAIGTKQKQLRKMFEALGDCV